ncbi:hypothetical protein CF336_g9059 [Tilletia laevis]|nr:hypothetical protein CF336_g9059 [Tilletia laevis]
MGDGRVVRSGEGHLVLTDERVEFSVNELSIEPERRRLLQLLPLYDGDEEVSQVNADRIRCGTKALFSVPVVLFIDDLSGARSKRWNKHEAVYFSNATLDRSSLDLDAHIRLMSISKDVSGEAQLSAAADELIELHRTFITVFDASRQENVMVRPHLLAIMADNPMAASLSSSIGMKGNRFCRLCHVDGSSLGLQTQDGMMAYLKEGDPRSADSIKAALWAQIEASSANVSEAEMKRLRTETGTKDEATKRQCDILYTLRKELETSGRSRLETDALTPQASKFALALRSKLYTRGCLVH